MTPYEIKLLLHYYTSPTEPDGNEPIRADTKAAFIRAGLLKTRTTPNGFGRDVDTTEALRVYCEALEAVPLPVQKWVVPND